MNESKNNRELILTLKINLDDNKINDIIVPDNINIDNIMKISREKYLDEILKFKSDELDKIKSDIESSGNENLSNQNLSDDKLDDLVEKKSFVNKKKDYYNRNINEPQINIKSPVLKEDELDENLYQIVPYEPKSDLDFNVYFDCIYIINLPEERSKIKNLTEIFKNDHVPYKVIDGVNIKNNSLYSKYFLRWVYQKKLDERLLNKYIFDEKIYLRNNAELINIYKTKIDLWNHYMKFGKSENRLLYKRTNIKLLSQLGNLIAHINVLKDAIKNQYSKILILEDDVYIHKNYKELHRNLIESIKNFNLLYYGCIQKKWEEVNIEKNNYKANNSYGAFAYAVDKRIFKILLEKYEELVNPTDKCLIEISNMNYSVVSYPNIFITDLENGKIHRKRDFTSHSKHFKWNSNNYFIN